MSKRAERDLRAIGDRIAVDNPARAASYTRELLSACEGVIEFPNRFPLVEGSADTHKRTFGRHLIYYRVRSRVITILGIRHAARRQPRFRQAERLRPSED